MRIDAYQLWRCGRCRSPSGRNSCGPRNPAGAARPASSIALGEAAENPVSRPSQRRDVHPRRRRPSEAFPGPLPMNTCRPQKLGSITPRQMLRQMPSRIRRFDDGALRVREQIRRSVENPEPERKALGIGQPVVPELNLGTVLVKRPVVLDALAVGDDDLLGDLIRRASATSAFVVREQPAHQVVPGQPYLVLPGAAEAGAFDDPQPLLQFPDRRVRRGSSAGSRRVSWEPRSPRATSSATTASSHTSRQALLCSRPSDTPRRRATRRQGSA